MALIDNMLDRLGRMIAKQLTTPSIGYEPFVPQDVETLRQTLQPGDVLLFDGNQKISNAIKYLTQSSWSHAALYVGEYGPKTENGELLGLVEAIPGEGVITSPLSKHISYHMRICRPVGLTQEEIAKVVRFALNRVGLKYDMRHIFDLARYLFPTPPLPVRWRRRMLALGSGEPTRAICSTLIAEAFQTVRYPILPNVERIPWHQHSRGTYTQREIFHIRHHSLFTPRDFDVSPYFKIVKPTIEAGFNPHRLHWADAEEQPAKETEIQSGAA